MTTSTAPGRDSPRLARLRFTGGLAATLTAIVTAVAPSEAFAQLVVTPAIVNASCWNVSDGRASVSVSGGVPPYNYNWSNGSSTNTATALPRGIHSLTVTDSTPGVALTSTRTVTISSPSALVLTLGTWIVTTYGGSDGALEATASGGAGGYTYFWPATGQTVRRITGLSAGVYTARVTDANDCVTERTSQLIQPAGVVSVSAPPDRAYWSGQSLDFIVNFSEAVTVTGTPLLTLSLNTGGTVSAAYVSGSGSSALRFRYVIQPADRDPDGVTVGAISMNGATILSNTLSSNVTLNNVGSTAGVLVTERGPEGVPTMTEWALILMGFLLAGGAATIIQRRYRTA